MSYRFADSLRAGSGRNWFRPDGQRNCSKHVEFYSKNKFENLVHLIGFIIGVKYVCIIRIETVNGRPLKRQETDYC